MLYSKALKQYQDVGVKSGVEEATPHRLVQMLLEGALSRIAAATGHISRKEVARKGEAIGHAISIIGGLQYSLDMEQGGDLATNLERLYDYMIRRLTEANLENDVEKLQEVYRLLAEIKLAWDELPAQMGQAGAAAGAKGDAVNS